MSDKLNLSISVAALAERGLKRSMKGNSLMFFPDDYVVIDIEATGFDPNYDEIIEISAVKFRDNLVVDYFESLVKPCRDISEYITSLTGITNEMVLNSPSIESVLPIFMDFIGNDILIAHNAHYDINFIYDYAVDILGVPLDNDFVDTLRMSRRLFTNLKSHRLIDLCNEFNLHQLPNHRSLQDCYAAHALFEYMNDYYKKNDFPPKLKPNKPTLRASNIASNSIEYDISHPFYGKHCVFTGTLQKMLRKDAMQLVANLGGTNGDNVTLETNYLILGSFDYCKSIKEGKSLKQKKAEKYKMSGQDIEVISEEVFYDLVFLK